MNIEDLKNVEDCKEYIEKKLEDLRPLFARAAIGDFSEDIPWADEDDEFTELYTGIQTILEIVRNKISALESEIGERQEVEQRLIKKNAELAQAHKAMMNILSDLQQSKSVVEQNEAKYWALINSIGDGIIATDKNEKMIFANEAASTILGVLAQDLLGKSIIETIRLEDSKGEPIPDLDRPIRKTLWEGRNVSSADYYCLRKNRERFPISINASPILLNENVIGAVYVFRDITKDKELDKAKSEFISIASHQLRTPVTALKWLSEISSPAVSKLTPKEKTYFKNLSSSIERLSKLVEDLLNVSRIELGTTKGEKVGLDLVKFVSDFSKDIQPYAELREHKLAIKDNVKTAPINMDSKMLYNVLQNLVSNAIDYSPAKTTVTITIDSEDNMAKVSIANEGPPIPADEQKKLFQKFYRGESMKKIKTEGTGLGLYIVKANIEGAGGKVGFESPARTAKSGGQKGKDTVFWFTLPIAK